jgi:UDP-GlcNAc3NAcA epimerase
MFKILTVVGARPQFIKAAAVSRIIRDRLHIQEIIAHTGQHFDENMSEIFFKQLNIPHPDYNLSISSLAHGAMTARMLERLEEIIIEEQPNWVLVYGDTNSTLAGALAASKLNVKVAHVEAGLRSNNMKMPEEQNRVLTDRLSRVLFCTSESAVNNLLAEGINKLGVDILNVGDVMYDAVLHYSSSSQLPGWFPKLNIDRFALASFHRAENTDDVIRLSEIVKGLNEVHRTTPVILPLHPRTRKKIGEFGLKLDVHTVEPVGYLEMIYLLKECSFVLTDSGGMQKEAYYFRKPCLVMRDETEWDELTALGPNSIVGANSAAIKKGADSYSEKFEFDEEIYGNGNAAELIVNYLERNGD